MIVLIQRVSEASVRVAGERIGAIGRGLLALVAFQPEDDHGVIERMLERTLDYRIFADEAGRMNRSLRETGGGLLLVPQFTLAADTRRGRRPSFSGGATPEKGASDFDALLALAHQRHQPVAAGRFGADMQVALVNDGPVTFWLASGESTGGNPSR